MATRGRPCKDPSGLQDEVGGKEVWGLKAIVGLNPSCRLCRTPPAGGALCRVLRAVVLESPPAQSLNFYPLGNSV